MYLIFTLAILALIPLIAILFTKQNRFGKAPKGERLKKIQEASNYRNGKFENINHTPSLTEGASYLGIMRQFFFGRNPNAVPKQILPSKKTDLKQLHPDEDCVVWFGHSGYFIQADGKKILVDPVLSGAASPVSFTTPSFKGSDIYKAEELPETDILFLSHDHWDHLDYDTILKINKKVKTIITSLGVGAHLEHWGIEPGKIIETNWGDVTELGNGFTVTTEPARHFSGRAFKRAQTAWSSFVLKTPSMNLYLGGDSGYDDHFVKIGEKHGPFDLAILECGQYNASWKYIHMMPEETVQAAIDLKAKKLFPVHWGKFALAMHDWDEPIKRVQVAAIHAGMPLVTPLIGEKVKIKEQQSFSNWWETLR